MIDEKFIEAVEKIQAKMVAEFRSKPCEQCPGCGRRSSSMIGDLCRDCYFSNTDPDEKALFEALCARHAVTMTNREIYLRRRKNILYITALAQDRFYSFPENGKQKELLSLYSRFHQRMDHLELLDEIWNYLHPIPMNWVSGSWGKSFEVNGASKAIKEGKFDSFCDELHLPRSLKKEI